MAIQHSLAMRMHLRVLVHVLIWPFNMPIRLLLLLER